MARLLSINVGLPREVRWNAKTVRTAVWKLPVEGRRMVRKLNIDGDAQADLAGHGGAQRAVFVYQMGSYHYWEHFLRRNDFGFGQFGENFTGNTSLGATILALANSARTSLLRDLLMTRSASVIDTASVMRCLK